MPQKPTSVIVLSILGILFSVMGVCGILAAAAVFSSAFQFAGRNEALEVLKNDSTYVTFAAINLAISIPMTLLLLAASIGSLTLSGWARIGMLIYACVTIITTLAGTAFNIAYAIPLQLSVIPQNSPQYTGATVGAWIGTCSGVLALIYPAFVLYFYTRPHVVNAFRGIFPPDERRFRDDRDEDDRYDDEDRRWDDDRNRDDDRFQNRR